MIPETRVCCHVRDFRTPLRKRGIGIPPDEARIARDEMIARLDREGEPWYRIAAMTGLSRRQVFRRLKAIRELRDEALAYDLEDEDRP